uniref:Uncharacterized protein n=1 Tax=Tanacetum cinerariifolium TaxID=118510 RepID=A0A6L2M2A7_TANCI|nr:hypothetical protein [Tanacetum cinerariifolium]
MDSNSSLGKFCLGEYIVEISSDKVERSRDWDSPEYQDTTNSGGKKETKAIHKMDTEEVSDRFVTPCFVTGPEAYDGEINFGVEENMISNEYAVKLCLEHEVKRGNIIVKKELIVAVREITDFEAGTITIYPDIDPFLEDTKEEEKNIDDWDQLLDFKLDDIPLSGGEELMSFEEATKEALALRISQKFALLEEVRPVLETMAYHAKYKKVLDEIWKDKVELDGMIVKEEAIKKVIGKALKEKYDPKAFIFPIRLEGQVNKNALVNTGSDINTMPYRIYEQSGREEMKKIDYEGRLIPEDPQPSVPRVGIPRPSRASTQDFYDRMGSMEIRQEAIERMDVPLQGDYNPPGYAQPRYDQYYQQYPPPPPQYQQQQDDAEDSVVKRSLFITPVAAKCKDLGATSVVMKSRLSVAKTLTATNKVSGVFSLSRDSSQIRFGNDNFATITGYGDYVQGTLSICHDGKYDIVSTSMAAAKLYADLQGTQVDQTKYHSMIGELMYLTSSRPDIAFATFDFGFELIAYSDADHVGCNDDCKSTFGGIPFLRDKLVSRLSKKQDCTAISDSLDENIISGLPPFSAITPDEHVLSTKKPDNSLSMGDEHLDTIPTTESDEFIKSGVENLIPIPIETLDNPFIASVNIKVIESFMQKIGYQGIVDKKKDVIQYPRFTKLIIDDLMKKYPSIPQRLDEDYHSIKDDILLVSVYSTGNVLFREMPIPNAFLTDEIHATNDYKETPTLTTASPQGKKRKQVSRETSSPRKSLKVTIRQKKQSTTLISPPGDDRKRDEMVEATLLSLTLYKTALAAEVQENIAKVQEKLEDEDIEKMVEGEEDEESYENDVTKKKNYKKDKDEEKDDDVEKTDDAAKEKDNDDHTDHTLVRIHATGSMETRNEQIQTPIPTPNRSFRKDLSSYKTISKELTAIVSPTIATTSKSKNKPNASLIYLNSKNEKRVMYLVEIVKFCDDTLEKVLKEVKLRIFQTKFWKKPPLLETPKTPQTHSVRYDDKETKSFTIAIQKSCKSDWKRSFCGREAEDNETTKKRSKKEKEDLKAQLQDKGIAINFSKSTSVTQSNVSNDFSKPGTAQTLPMNKNPCLKNMNVLAPRMYKLHTDHTQARTSKLPQDSKKTNKRVSFSTGVIPTTSVSRPQLKSNPQGDRVMYNNSQGKKKEVEDHRRSVKLSKNKMSITACNDSLNAKTMNVKSVFAMCDQCVLIDKHDMCVLKSADKPLKETVASESNNKPRNFTRKLYERISKTCSWWYPKFTPSGYIWKPKSGKENVNPNLSMPLGKASRTANLIEIVLFIVDSRCSKHMTGNLKLLINFVEKFLGTVKFENDQIAPILRYGDLVQGSITIKRVYYVEGLNYNLFSVGQFYDKDLEVAFRKSTCFIRDLKGNDLLTGSRGTDLYSITLRDTNCPNLICLMAKATSSQAWLWHRRLSHLNFDTNNLLSKNDIVVGLP